MKLKKEKMVRMNSNIRPDQKEFVKKEAKKIFKQELHEGELHRLIIDEYINNHYPIKIK